MNETAHPFLPPLERPLILASRSPRRAEILRQHRLSFEIVAPEIPEHPLENESPEDHVRRLGEEKARAVAHRFSDAVCLGCDTVVVLDEKILGKPRDVAHAKAMLARLSGREHTVFSSVALVQEKEGFSRTGFQTTRVRMRPLSKPEIAAYVDTGEPLDKAGAYGIQGYGSMLVYSIIGGYFNVMGLPLQALRSLWMEYLDRH